VHGHPPAVLSAFDGSDEAGQPAAHYGQLHGCSSRTCTQRGREPIGGSPSLCARGS
jgi:hypothetical protein